MRLSWPGKLIFQSTIYMRLAQNTSLKEPFQDSFSAMDSGAGKGWYHQVLPRDNRPTMATSLKIDDTLKGRIQHLASQRRRSPHWIVLETPPGVPARPLSGNSCC